MVQIPVRHMWAATILFALTACGTTVPMTQQRTTGAGGDALSSGNGVVPTEGSGTTGTTGGTGGAGTSGLPGGTGASNVGAGASAGTSGSGTQGGSTVTGTTGAAGTPKLDPITVGVFHLNGGNQVISTAFPGSSVSFGDGKKEAQAIIDDINAHGGAGGHKIVPVWIPIEATDNDTNRQQKCLGAVQDHRPIALMAIFNLTAGLAKCVEQSNTLMIDVALGAGDEQLYSIAKNLAFSPSQITRDAEQKLVLALARKEGKLPAGKTVGLIDQSDDPMYPRVMVNTVEPLLKSWGVPFIRHSLANGTDTSGMSNAILKFQGANVDTVAFSLGSGGIPVVLFMQAAEQQQFRPAYLMGDSTNTNFVGSQAPAEQIKRISGAGTYPLANVRADQYASPPAEAHCIKLLNAAIGGYNDRYSSLTGTLYCEILYSFAFVSRYVKGPLNSRTWATAFHSLGSAYTPVTSFTTRFLPGRPDGASSYRSVGYGAACGCITYTSPVRPIPAS